MSHSKQPRIYKEFALTSTNSLPDVNTACQNQPQFRPSNCFWSQSDSLLPEEDDVCVSRRISCARTHNRLIIYKIDIFINLRIFKVFAPASHRRTKAFDAKAAEITAVIYHCPPSFVDVAVSLYQGQPQ